MNHNEVACYSRLKTICNKYDKLFGKSYPSYDECMIHSFNQLTDIQNMDNLDATEFCNHRYNNTNYYA